MCLTFKIVDFVAAGSKLNFASLAVLEDEILKGPSYIDYLLT